jgi:hypothetical protein
MNLKNITLISLLSLSVAVACGDGGGSGDASSGDGDGDASGDGDGDASGDGDGDGDTSGDGDGDASGDGDGDGDTSGDGDGDGDTAGDGDGDGDASGDGDGDGDTSGDGDGDGLGGAPPASEPARAQILSTSPADGEAGVHPDSSLVIEFDAAMDIESVEAAFSSEKLTNVEFEWNDDDTILTVHIVGGMDLAEGDNLDIEAIAYGFTIGTEARTAEGVALEEELSVAFTTFRRILFVLDDVPLYSGTVRPDSFESLTMWVGDTAVGDGSQYVGVVTFDLSELPEVIGFGSATLAFTQAVTHGDPYGLLGGQMDLYDTYFETMVWEQVADDLTVPLGVLSDEDAIAQVSFNVKEAVSADYEQGIPAQFAMAFPIALADNDQHDIATLYSPTLELFIYTP